MSTYFICLAAYLTGWPIVQFLAWPVIHRGWLAAKEHETRLQVAEEMVKLLTENGSEIDKLRSLLDRWVVDADAGNLDGVSADLMSESEAALEPETAKEP